MLLGTTSHDAPKEKTLFAGDDRVYDRGLLLANNAITRGQVMSRIGAPGAEKYRPLAVETVVSAAETVANVTASTLTLRRLAHARVVPGTLALTVGGTAQVVQNNGRILTPGNNPNQIGSIDWETGEITFEHSAAVDTIRVTYVHLALDFSADPVAVAVATYAAQTADLETSFVVAGTLFSDDLVWPAGMTDANRNRALAALEAQEIYVVTR